MRDGRRCHCEDQHHRTHDGQGGSTATVTLGPARHTGEARAAAVRVQPRRES